MIEGVTAAVKWVEALVSLRLGTAKRGDYARPLAKRYDGEFARFSPAGDVAGATRAPGSAGATGAAAVGVNASTSTGEIALTAPTHIHSV